MGMEVDSLNPSVKTQRNPFYFYKSKSNTICLVVSGKPVAKQRHGFNRKTGRAFPKRETTVFENDVREIWREKGEPRLEGAIRITVTIYLERPNNHFLKSGNLSAAGQKLPYPIKRPDADNVFKSVTDALNTRAYKDDSQIIEARIKKLWGERQKTVIIIQPG